MQEMERQNMTFDPRAKAAQIAKKTSDQISGEWPLLMNDLERIVESALLAFAREVLTQEPDEGMLVQGSVPHGLSTNKVSAIYRRMSAHRAKSLEDGK